MSALLVFKLMAKASESCYSKMLSDNTKGGKSLPTLIKEAKLKEGFQKELEKLIPGVKVVYVDLKEEENG